MGRVRVVGGGLGRAAASVALELAALTIAAAGAVAIAPASAGAAAPLRLDLAGGERLMVQGAPFRLWLENRDGREEVGTVPAALGSPVRPPGVTGPQPIEPLGPAGAFPPFGFVVGAGADATFPQPPFTGNQLFGAQAGAVVSVTGVQSARTDPNGVHLQLSTDAVGLGPATLDATALPTGGVRLVLRPPAGLQVEATMFTLSSPVDEGLYGGGTRRDAFDQRGLLRNVWVEEQYFGDQRTEPVTAADPTGFTGPAFTVPNGAQMAFFVQAELSGSRGWTAWVEQSELQQEDLARSRPDAVRWSVAADHLVLSLAGGGLEQSIRAYTARAGRAPAPPKYVYAPWLDRINENGEGEAAPNGGGFTGGAAVKADLQTAVSKIHALGLPISTFGVEGWHAVPGAASFFPGLRAQGFDLVAYWNPFLAPGMPATNEALALGIVVKGADGNPYPIVTNRGNVSYVIDFSNPAAQGFWDRQIARSCDLGFEGLHQDFGEFVTDGMRFYDGTPPAVMHNRYPILYARATRAALATCAASHPGVAPFFYARTGFSPLGDLPGTLAYTPAYIVGDETTDFSRGSGLASVPPAMLNLALGGGSTFISDIGGYFDLYTPRTTPELFTRWSQLSALTPVMRIHDDTINGSLYPWDFDPATLDAYRRYARLKVRLEPLVARLTQQAASDGSVGPVRPLVLDDPSPAARGVGDEWLLGRDVLVAPVLTQGALARPVYLPAGARWQRVTVDEGGQLVPTGDVRSGGQTVQAPAPLADIPLYGRLGAPSPAGPLASLPPGRSCASRRRFRIRLHHPPGTRLVSAVVRVNGRRVRVLRGRRLTAVVNLRGLPPGRFTVTIVARTASGQTVRDRRRYRTCTPRRLRPGGRRHARRGAAHRRPRG